jgi:hypothetical protein
LDRWNELKEVLRIQTRAEFANILLLGVNLHFMKVSTENDNNYGYEKITILVDNIPLSKQKVKIFFKKHDNLDISEPLLSMHTA